MESWIQDLRYGIRTLLRSPGFAAVAVLTLGLGIGSNTAVFSVVNAVLVRPLPYEDPDRLTLIWTEFGPDLPQNWVSPPEFVEMQELSTQFASIAVVAPSTRSLTGSGEPEQITSAGASGDFFDVMGVEATAGRLFGDDEDVVGGEPVVVLSDGFWRRRFGGNASILGQTIRLDDLPYSVIGVLPPDFAIMHPDAGFPKSIDTWSPLAPAASAFFGGIGSYAEMSRGSHFMRAFGRLKPGVSLSQARADMDSVAVRIQEKSPDYYDFDGWGINVISLHDDLVEDVRPALIVLLGAVAFVLLIACVNVANLLLTRAAGREREIALRSALGAGRGRVMRQLLTESVVLSGAGGLLGLGLAVAMMRAIGVVAPDTLPRGDQIAIDGGVLAFTFGVSVLTGILFGLAPAIHGAKQSLVESLKEGGRGSTTGIRGRRVQTVLVVSEVALALVLLVGAGLMIQSFSELARSNPGYRPDGVMTLRVSLPSARYDAPAQAAFFDEVLERVAALPGVTSAGTISHLPLSGIGASGTTWVDRSDTVTDEMQRAFEADRRWVSPDYFTTLGVQLVKGRFFSHLDGPDAPPVAIVDQEFVRRFWPTEDPIGRLVSVNAHLPDPTWREVVGVVAHSRHTNVDTIGREQAYYPYRQMPQASMFVAARTEADPSSLAAAMRAEVWAVDANQPVADVQAMSARVDQSLAQPRFNALLLAGFAVIALLLAAVGIYGVISYSVSQRRHEIGVRMALGAGAGQVHALVLRQGMTLVIAGLVIGGIVALWLSRSLATLLYNVRPSDPVTYALVAIVLATVGAASCVIPALRATRVELVSVLQE